MIFTVLFNTQILQGHKYRNIVLYTIGTIFYALVHWLMYSYIGNSIPLISKYRSLMYVMVLADIAIIYRKFDESYKHANVIENDKPIIEIVEPVQEQPTCVCDVNNKLICEAQCEKPMDEKKESESSLEAIPVYEPQKCAEKDDKPVDKNEDVKEECINK